MKKILICLTAILCVSCTNDLPKVREPAYVTKTNYLGKVDDLLVAHIQYDNHEYIAFKERNGWICGIIHSPNCKCLKGA